MSDIRWPLEPHTVGKHKVLKAYLDAWLPILGRWQGRILFIDGFAGPGEYADGQPGSPIIALDALIAHNAVQHIKAEVHFYFIEAEELRATHLERLVESRRPRLPKGCRAEVHHGEFTKVLGSALDDLEKSSGTLAPSFVMIDPFGISGAPMSVIRRVMKHSRCEVYFSFMYDWINRFVTTDEFEEHLDELFGTPDWRAGIQLINSDERKHYWYELYERELRGAGALDVLRLELYRENRLIYTIFFATKSHIGCDRMKQAIWKVAPLGDFQFRGTRSSQLDLFSTPDFSALKNQLQLEFRPKGWVTIDSINEFMRSDKIDFHSSQHKKNVLIPMEEAGEIEVDSSTRRKRKSFPDGTRLRFL